MISEIIAAYLKDQLPAERVYSVGTYYPGELPFCLRAQYFRYTQPAKALGSDRENLFGVGLLWQACVEEALQGANVTVLEARKIRKLKVPDSNLVLLCEPDFVIEIDGAKLVVELKTAASLAKFSEPMREHLLQVTAYMQVTKTADALIVYLNKQSGEVKEFPVHLEPENLLLLFERARRLDQALVDRALPARVGAGQEWQCKGCEFVTECETFQGDSMTEHRTVWVDRVKIDATSKNLEETDQYLLVKNVVLSRQGVFPYDGGKVFKSADELKAGAWTLEGAWIVAYQHPDSFVFDRDDIRGRSVNIRFDEDKAALVGDLRFEKSLCVKDKALLPGVKSGEMREVSVGFSSDDKRLPGTFGDEAYTFVQTRYLFDHVAIALTEGRCPAPFCGIALDSISDANFVQVELGKAAPGTFPPRVITWSEKEGILAAVGKRDPAADAEVLRYLFSKAKGWTLEKAQAWTKEHKDAAGELSEKELRARIVELENKRQEILDKLYPPPKRLPPAEERVLQLELNLIDGEVHALTEVLAEKLAGVEGSVGDGADKGKKPAAPDSEAKPCKCHLVVAREEVERARRLLGSR
jgi:CRISPR/Cas system-associated exonuclease Cas4 (RecB family)